MSSECAIIDNVYTQNSVMSTISVRTGTPLDVHPLMDCAIAACSDNGLIEHDPEKLLIDIWPALNLDRGIVGIIGNEVVEAAILLRVDKLFYTNKDMLLERSLFVRPEFRKSGDHRISRAKLLCAFAKEAAAALNLQLIIGILTHERVAGKIKLYEREFGEPAGAYWVYDPSKKKDGGGS